MPSIQLENVKILEDEDDYDEGGSNDASTVVPST